MKIGWVRPSDCVDLIEATELARRTLGVGYDVAASRLGGDWELRLSPSIELSTTHTARLESWGERFELTLDERFTYGDFGYGLAEQRELIVDMMRASAAFMEGRSALSERVTRLRRRVMRTLVVDAEGEPFYFRDVQT